MLAFLKDHPFAVEAYFESSLVLTYALPKENIIALLPPCLEPYTFQEKWAFVAAALVQTKDLRPKGFPKFIGNDFFLIGYRVFVKYVDNKGKHLRGLYILKSQTDKKKMEFFGNIFTHYNYSTTDIRQEQADGKIKIKSSGSDFEVEVETTENVPVPLPPGSPFANWKEARRFAGPLPFTFTYTPATSKVLIIEGVRENWEPRPVRVCSQHFSFIENLSHSKAQLANAFMIRGIPYYWKKGRVERWMK